MERRNFRSRFFFVFLIFIAALSFFLARIISIQLFKSPHLSELAHNQHNILLEIEPERGEIYDRNLNTLAIDCPVYSVYAAPDRIEKDDRLEIARSLSGVLRLDKEAVLEKLSQEKSFVWIKREIEKGLADRVDRQELEGIYLIKEHKRFYPKGSLASHLIGFTGMDDTGLEGVEYTYEGYLKGSPGWRWTVRDAKRRDIVSKDTKYIPPSDGLNVILTIDEAIQHIAERELERVYKRYKAKGASIIIMDPHNGDILALANRPSFDLNEFASTGAESLRNKAVADLYEPGSVFKIVTASCAVEKNAVNIDQTFFCEDGEYYIGGRILHDHKPHGDLTFEEIIKKSSNIGMTKVAQVLGKKEVYEFIKLFGFNRPTGIDMPGEAKGILSPPHKWSATSISAIPIGQEIAVTSIQLITAMSAIANGGYLMKPRVVREIRDGGGNSIKTFEPVTVRRILSYESADKMRSILRGAVDNGTGKRAGLDGYTAAGKTGTAQKLEPDGRYSHAKFIASFIGFAPADDPKIVVLVSVDEPRPLYYGGTVAAPVFKNTATDVLRYLKIEPDRGGKSANL